MAMPRPKKDPALVKGEVLRVPVSLSEKELIFAAATCDGGEFASWARMLLLKAAKGWAAGNPAKSR